MGPVNNIPVLVVYSAEAWMMVGPWKAADARADGQGGRAGELLGGVVQEPTADHENRTSFLLFWLRKKVLKLYPHFVEYCYLTQIPFVQAEAWLAPSEYQQVPAYLLGSGRTCEPSFYTTGGTNLLVVFKRDGLLHNNNDRKRKSDLIDKKHYS